MKKTFSYSATKARDIIRRYAVCLPVIFGLLALSGCVESQIKPVHFRLTPESLAKRQLQTRIFDTDDESAVLAAGTATLQDIGFLVDDSEVQLGLIVASKERSAIQPAEVTAQILITILVALAGQSHDPVWDETQIMRVSLVVTPAAEMPQEEGIELGHSEEDPMRLEGRWKGGKRKKTARRKRSRQNHPCSTRHKC